MTKQRRLVVLGFTMVGKTAICSRLCTNRFRDDYEPTYENSFRRTIQYNGQDVDVIITDTQGQDEQELFRNEYCLGAHGYLLVFSVASPRSLQNVAVINEKLINLMGTNNVARVLVGNKIDLESHRRVLSEEGLDLSQQWGCPYVECSAKQNSGIDEVFRLALREIDRFNDDDVVESSGCCPSLPKFCEAPELSLEANELILAGFALVNLLLAIAAIVTSISIAARVSGTDEMDLLAYVLFGFGMLSSIASSLGLIGVRKCNQECTYAFAIVLAVLVAVEGGTVVFVFPKLIPSIGSATSFVLPSAIIAFVQIYTVILAYRYYKHLVSEAQGSDYTRVPDELFPHQFY